MRYYRIEITDPNNPKFSQVYTSHPNGKNDPGALNVHFHLILAAYASVQRACIVQIQGIPITSINNASNLNNKNVTIYGGFQKGLPLATPSQSGILAQGFIAQAFGNWLGNDMTLDLVVLPGSSPATAVSSAQSTAAQSTSVSAIPPTIPTGTMTNPINGQFSWLAGTQLSTAIENFITTALPNFPKPVVQISPKLVISSNQYGTYSSLEGFSKWVKPFSRSVINPNPPYVGGYAGVDITMQPANVIFVTDGTVKNTTKNIEFRDLIGQPTWISPGEIQFKTPMRADIQVQNNIVLPSGFYPTISPQQVDAPYNYRNSSLQQGDFVVTGVSHYGDFRQPSAESWVSVFNCNPVLKNIP